MVRVPPNSAFYGAPQVDAPANEMLGGLYLQNEGERPFIVDVLLALGLHVGILALIAAVIFLLNFWGIHLLSFNPPKRVSDIEFQLVNAPTEKPRNPNTKNRAEHATRSGGQKIPNMREAQSQRMAGNPKPQARPQAQPAKPAPTVRAAQPAPRPQPNRSPQPPKPQPPKPVAGPTNNSTPAPPRPRVTAPTPSPNRTRIAAVPNPLAPIHVPSAPSAATETGPLVHGPVGGSGSATSTGHGGGGSRPATLPGQFSSSGGGGGSPGRSGGVSGQGGNGSYSQYGSPGGGGGRPGIDAQAEPDFGPYLAELQRRIRRNWSPPDDKQDKTIVMSFVIARDGRLISLSIHRSSGFANADNAARQAIERSAPFRPLPAEYRHNSINVDFTFDYNVFTGRSGGLSRG